MADGILLLDKPLGLSSNGALQRVRRAYGAAKAGHVGSLDPLATGMLPICLGEATKVAGEIVSGRKRYAFTVALGTRTSTGDVEGEITGRAPVQDITTSQLDAVLNSFTGDQEQIPPMYSALKRDGQPLYKLARKGVEVERAPRAITIHALTRSATGAGSATGADSLDLAVECSKGTYVRVLAEDIARALGTCGHVSALRRLAVEPFEGEPMLTLDAVLDGAQSGNLPPLLPPERGLPGWPVLVVDGAQVASLRHGQAIATRAGAMPGKIRCHDAAGTLVAIALRDALGRVQPSRVFSL